MEFGHMFFPLGTVSPYSGDIVECLLPVPVIRNAVSRAVVVVVTTAEDNPTTRKDA
jgi:hypothetical protein